MTISARLIRAGSRVPQLLAPQPGGSQARLLQPQLRGALGKALLAVAVAGLRAGLEGKSCASKSLGVISRWRLARILRVKGSKGCFALEINPQPARKRLKTQ